MGKGLIVSNKGDGLYSVQVILSKYRIALTITKLNADIAATDAYIVIIQADIAKVDVEIAALRADILAWQLADPKKNADKIKSALKSVESKLITRAGLTAKLSTARLKRKGIEMRIAYLSGHVPADETFDAWCADLTDDLTGYVGTIEVPGERGDFLIQPGFDGNAVYNTVRDGQLQPSIAGTPESVFWNLALLPGWQKWKPTYRYGTITAKTGDTCSVALEVAHSSQQGLLVNQGVALANVPIDYMD